jgi:hypothetical protein
MNLYFSISFWLFLMGLADFLTASADFGTFFLFSGYKPLPFMAVLDFGIVLFHLSFPFWAE